MNILALSFLTSLIVFSLFLIAALIIEKNFSENHPVMKWWRKYVVGKFPDDDPNF
jgi:hypothetical protein